MAETREKPENQTKPRGGLSINDTIAANANLSVGATGVDTSGVKAGAGAGAGSTYLTAGGSGRTPAPAIVPGARGSVDMNESTKGRRPGVDEISARAYQRWHQRGCPDGSPEVDWRAAEEELAR